VTSLSPPARDATPPAPLHQRIRGNQSKLRSSLTDELVLGRRKLTTAFRTSPPRILKPGELLATLPGCRSAILRLRAGWACQFRVLSNGRTVIIDVYLPGDVIGLDTLLRTQRLDAVLALTSVILEVIPAEDGFLDLIADRSIAIYIFWLLGQRQRRADRRLAANTRLEPQARLSMMMLDFYARLRGRELVPAATYNLPLTQPQIGDYLGLSAVHVNRVLRSLREERVLNLEKNCVTILDLKRLRKLACDEEVVNSAMSSASTAVGLSVPNS
jgi:CRP/FNR family transcriptional regulator, anaerobic regulatory protein